MFYKRRHSLTWHAVETAKLALGVPTARAQSLAGEAATKVMQEIREHFGGRGTPLFSAQKLEADKVSKPWLAVHCW